MIDEAWKPLGELFVSDGEVCVEAEGHLWGPFFSADVAHAWGRDAFGDAFRVRFFRLPRAVPISERKS